MPRSHSVRIRSLTARGSHRQRPRVWERAGPHLTDRGGEVMATVAVHDDMFTDDVIADPSTYYGRLREEDPIHWNDKYALWVITRHDDVVWMARHHELFSNAFLRNDPRLAAAMARAYNNWLYDFCQENPDRLIGAGMISPFDVQDAVAETRRCVTELGFRGVFLRPNEVNGHNWHDLSYEPLWSVLEELEVPLGFHEGAGSQLRQVGEQFATNPMLKHVYCHPVEQMLAVGSFCGGGILERHPRLR